MSWIVLTTADISLTAAEQTAVDAVTDVDLADKLQDAADEFRGAISGGGQAVEDTAYAIPDNLKSHVANKARWEWLTNLPAGFETLHTKAREEANKRADAIIDKLAAGKFRVEAPEEEEDLTVSTGGKVEIVTKGTRLATRAKLKGLL